MNAAHSNPKLAAAYEAVNRGLAVFPLRRFVDPGPDATEDQIKAAIDEAKRPAIKNFRNEATTDKAQIKAWFAGDPELNLGASTEGLTVVDVDLRSGGRDSYDRLSLVDGFPDTLKIRTQSGGWHLYYRNPPHVHIANSVGKRKGGAPGPFGFGIDIRADGGYAVLPGSNFGGRTYAYENDAPIARTPEWIIETAKKRTPREPGATVRLIEEDEEAVARATDWSVRWSPEATEGHRNQTAADVAATYYDFGVSRSTAENLLLDWNYSKCHPALDPEEIKAIAGSRETSRVAPIGWRHSKTHAFQAYDIWSTGGPVTFQALLERQVGPVADIIGGLVEKGVVTFLSAAGGLHKSRFAVQVGLCIETGTAVFGRPVERAGFVYLSCEDHADEVARRAQAIARRLNISSTNARYWDRVGKDSCFAVVRESGDVELRPFYGVFSEYLRSIPGHKFVVVDGTYDVLQFAGHAKVNESSVMSAIKVLQRLCDECDATLMCLWHPSQAGQERGDASGWSVAWHNKPRARLSLNAVKGNEDAVELRIEKRNHGAKGKPITLYWSEGALLPRSAVAEEDCNRAMQQAVVAVATKAAETGVPMTQQRTPARWQFDDVEAACGWRPSNKEFKDLLASALAAGQLSYLKGTTHRAAGYYPADVARAEELARDAKRQRQSAKEKVSA